MIKKSLLKFIIPSAGLGIRAGSPNAKEVLNNADGRPLIEFSLLLARKYQCRAHVITRKEKTSLLNYLDNFDHVDIQIIGPSKEWPDTILQSQNHWGEKNIILLPDTYFSPVNIINQLILDLNDVDISLATFNPPCKKTWGVINTASPFYECCEKPNIDYALNDSIKAWGLLAFTQSSGKEILSTLLETTFDHEWKKTALTFRHHSLEHFIDLTRGDQN